MINTDVCIIGAGPAGLAASIEAAKSGAKVLVIDENFKVGGQLFKQIHKFFGSREHQAGVRGINIGTKLLEEATDLGAEFRLRTVAYAIFEENVIGIYDLDKQELGLVKAKKIIVATGAIENTIPFKGCTKPGVMGAGAAQTLMHIYKVQPGQKVLMVGSGNVGLIASYQMMQAGVEVCAIVEAAPNISGYQVHARKLLRAGVPIYTSTTIKETLGEKSVEGAIICSLDDKFQMIEGTEKKLDVDTVCIAVGLSPLIELLQMAGCELTFVKALGGFIPKHNKVLQTSNADIYIAGDVSGVEEASSAMEEGRIAAIDACEKAGFIDSKSAKERLEICQKRLDDLRQGPFGERRKQAKESVFANAFELETNKEEGMV